MSAFEPCYVVIRWDGMRLYTLDRNGADKDGDSYMDADELARCRDELNPFSGPIELDANCKVDLVVNRK